MYNGRLSFLGHAWRHALVLIAVLFALAPILWIISASFNPSNTIVGQSLIPPNPTLDHYRQLFEDPRHPFHLWLWNSTKVAVIAATLTVTLTALGAYAFSRFRGRRGGLFTLILIQMFPQMLAMVAIYLLMLQLGELFPSLGLNTHAGLIMVYLGGALGVNTWLMKGYCSRWGIFAAGALLGALPIVLIFLLMQNQLVSGLTSGAVKE